MEHVDDDALRDALWTVEGAAPAIRVLALMAYRNGVSQTELANWLGVERKTVYNWLRRFEEQPGDPVTAARDADKSGRPAKLDESSRSELLEQLRSTPSKIGYGRESWTPELVRRHVKTSYDIEYSLGSCRRLLRDAGLVYRKPKSDDEVVTDADTGRQWLLDINE